MCISFRFLFFSVVRWNGKIFQISVFLVNQLWQYPLAHPPNTSTSSKPFHFLAGDQLVVPIGTSHISSWLQEIQSMEWEEREQTNNMLGLIQAQEEALCNIAFPMCICRLTLARISCEISTKLQAMPTHLDRSSLTSLDPISCRLVTSAVLCRLATRVILRQLFCEFFCPTPLAYPYPLPVTSKSRAQAFVWFRAKTDKGIVCLADHLHTVTQC